MKPRYFLVLDIGTSGTKGVLFDADLELVAEVRKSFILSHPKKGWVEEDPNELYKKSVQVLTSVLKKAQVHPKQIISLGITNQRETIILWDEKTGKPVYPAIVWEDTRTKSACSRLKKYASVVRQMTGLTIDPYFSASKIQWILNNIPAAKILFNQKRLRCGTVDAWIMWRLTNKRTYATDETNASRTLLFNVHTRTWSQELCSLFDVPMSLLPKVKTSKDLFGFVDAKTLGAKIPIRAVCGDQQSSLYAAGNKSGVTKVTYGTGTFVGQHLGVHFEIHPSFFTTMMPSGKTVQFAFEGKIARGGKEVEPLLPHPKKMKTFLFKLAKDVDRLLKVLPNKPKKLFIDGGVMRDGIVGGFQKDLSHIPVVPLSVVNGTAYGVAKLLKEQTFD